jgi:hypothetical protein
MKITTKKNQRRNKMKVVNLALKIDKCKSQACEMIRVDLNQRVLNPILEK